MATEDDLQRIAEMTVDLINHTQSIRVEATGIRPWHTTVDKCLPSVRKRLENPKHVQLVAVEEGEVVGMIVAEVKTGSTAEIIKGYVEPAHRRRGISRRLDSALVKISEKRGSLGLNWRSTPRI